MHLSFGETTIRPPPGPQCRAQQSRLHTRRLKEPLTTESDGGSLSPRPPDTLSSVRGGRGQGVPVGWEPGSEDTAGSRVTTNGAPALGEAGRQLPKPPSTSLWCLRASHGLRLPETAALQTPGPRTTKRPSPKGEGRVSVLDGLSAGSRKPEREVWLRGTTCSRPLSLLADSVLTGCPPV